MPLSQGNILQAYEDIANLILESQIEKKVILGMKLIFKRTCIYFKIHFPDPKQNHIGLGISLNEESAIVVLVVSSRYIKETRNVCQL